MGLLQATLRLPRDFTWLLKPLVSLLRVDSAIPAPLSQEPPPLPADRPTPPTAEQLSQGVRIIQFLDDFMNQHEDPWEATRHMQLVLHWLVALGFIIHARKSVLRPTQIITWLGMVIDSVRMRLRLTRPRRLSLRRSARALLQMQERGRRPGLDIAVNLYTVVVIYR
eukprot:SAG11_NODE_10093_length_855_cov_2.478836_1_plen_167_part_00